jgi:hypothetical protein
MVFARPGWSGLSAAAWARGCQKDQNQRPISGFVNFLARIDVERELPTYPCALCDTDVDISAGSSLPGANVKTVVHEIYHAMGFSSNDWKPAGTCPAPSLQLYTLHMAWRSYRECPANYISEQLSGRGPQSLANDYEQRVPVPSL